MNAEIQAPRNGAQAEDGTSQRPRILLFGDSHSHAIQRAIEKRQGKGARSPIAAYRLLKEKNGRSIGEMTFDDFLAKVGKLGPEDIVLSMIGGNQHAVFSTIQHPKAFDFFASWQMSPPDFARDIVPFRALEHAFTTGLERGDGKSTSRTGQRSRIPPPQQRSFNRWVR